MITAKKIIAGLFKKAAPTTTDPIDATIREFTIRDSRLPLWAVFVSGVFSIATGLIWLSISVSAVFFVDIALQNKDDNLIFIFTAVGLIALAAGFALDIAHGRALRGLTHPRRMFSLRVGAIMAVVMGGFLAIVHPLLSVGFFAGTSLILMVPTLSRAFPAWFAEDDPDHAEALSMLAGRDSWSVDRRLKLARIPPGIIATIIQFAFGIAVLVTIAVSSWLVLQEVITVGALFGSTLMVYWGVHNIASWAQNNLASPHFAKLESLDYTPPPSHNRQDIFEDEVAQEQEKGLVVAGLSVKNAATREILVGSTSFKVKPGQIMGITGESGGGKSNLLRALIGQTNHKDLLLKGAVLFDSDPLWSRSFSHRGLPAVFVPSTPTLLPGSAVDNILCFEEENNTADAISALQKLDVFGVQAARIATRADAMVLSQTEAQILSLARAFYLNPGLYLFDMPENNLTQVMISTLISQISVEKNAGRSFVIATRNRTILEICDDMLVMEDGHIADFGTGSAVLARQASGWARLTLPRTPESEDRLHIWARAQFNRKGDEKNRRNACLLVSELLALTCQDNPAEGATVVFDFKHFKGFSQFAMQDDQDPISTAAIQAAGKLADKSETMSPRQTLANILKLSAELLQDIKGLEAGNRRRVRVKLDVYDPRKMQNSEMTADGDNS